MEENPSDLGGFDDSAGCFERCYFVGGCGGVGDESAHEGGGADVGVGGAAQLAAVGGGDDAARGGDDRLLHGRVVEVVSGQTFGGAQAAAPEDRGVEAPGRGGGG